MLNLLGKSNRRLFSTALHHAHHPNVPRYIRPDSYVSGAFGDTVMRRAIAVDRKVLPPVFTADEAICKFVEDGDDIYVMEVAGAPRALIDALARRGPQLKEIHVHQIHTEGPAPYVAPELENNIRVRNYFMGHNMREAVSQGRADFVPMFLSEVPLLFRRGIVDLNSALITVSPPDRHGFCLLGTSVAVSRAAVETAEVVIAVINKNMPHTHGASGIHISQIDAVVYSDDPLPTPENKNPTPLEDQIGKYAASLVKDGDCLQMGIGAIPNAVLSHLKDRKCLGIHTEMFSDGVIDLYNAGVITNTMKKILPGKITTGFVMGSQKTYDFVDNNPAVSFNDIGWVNDTEVIRQNSCVVAINSCIEIDLTGQIVSDSIGELMFSGVGGQLDFTRGAMMSPGGRPIFVVPSTTHKGISRIVPTLKPGGGVVTTRCHVRYVVTEYGIADLYGRSLSERAKALIEIAHPDHRASLQEAAFKRFGKHFKSGIW